MTVNLKFTTPCGHEATVRLCQAKSGKNLGKWVMKIRGPRVPLKSGVKTIYVSSNSSEHALKQSISSFLNIDASVIVNGNSAVVKTEASKMETATSASMTTMAPSRVSLSPHFPPPIQQQPSQLGFVPSAFPPPVYGATYGPPTVYGGNNTGYIPPIPPAGVPYALAGSSTMPILAQIPPNTVAPGTNSYSMSSQVAATAASTSSSQPVAPGNEQAMQTSAAALATNTMVPTAEQERIYQHAKPPTPLDTNFTVRITAGAGAGKTTTVLQVAAKAAQLGHSHITYVTFSKAAATDGTKRIQEALQNFPNAPTVEARTLHSCAMNLLSKDRKEEREPDNGRLIDDEGLQAFIKTVCQREIEDFLLHAKEEIASRTKADVRKAAPMLVAAERQVCFYVYKTFTQFCRSPYTAEQFKDQGFKYRNYYPAERFHTEGMEGEKQGFPPMVYKFKVGRYADLACLVWDAANEQGIRSYDMEMKRAQLKALRIPGSLLLVDESQDMDGCQVDWISKQCNHGTHVYIVGDAAQTIYSFRGAKSKYMVNLKGTVDFELTKSWRFGPAIASVANVVLFTKHKSKQTQQNNSTWQPYRVVGGGGDGIVTTEPILCKWRETPITVIAAFNATLLHTAASMLGMNVDSSEVVAVPNEEDVKMEVENDTTQSESNHSVPIVSDDTVKTEETSECVDSTSDEGVRSFVKKEDPLLISMPKIHINGQGENSGLRKWQSNLKQIEHIYELLKSGDEGMVLPRRTFKEFNGERITWDVFCSQVESREMTKYMSSIHVVSTFQEKTMEAMDLFRREVMDKKYSAEEADVILTTTHAAKGMEWDNVQVCGDFTDLFKLSMDGPLTAKRGGAGSNVKRQSWQFHVKSYGDDVNLLYVACTRAKKLLSIPPSLKTFLQDCDILHEMIRFKKLFRQRDMTKTSDIVVFGRKQPLSVEEALDVYQDIVLPLRMENNLKTKERLTSALIQPFVGEVDYEDDMSMPCDDEFEVFFGCQTKPPPPLATATTPNGTKASDGVAASSMTQSDTGPVAKKPKLSRAHAMIEEAKTKAALAPPGTKRPYDKKEVAAHTAKCRECGTDISVGTSRVGVQIYKQEKAEWWCMYFHDKCFPKELVAKLRLDPNPNREKPASKKSSYGKKSYGRGYKKSWGGGGWSTGGGYRKRWY